MGYIDWFITLSALAVIYIIVNNYSQELTPELYIVNTYLYILLAIIIVAASWNILDKSPALANDIFGSGWNLVALIVLSFVSLFCTMLSSPKNIGVKHLAWFILVATLGITSYVCYIKSITDGTLGHIFVSLIVLMSILTLFAYSKPVDHFDSWGAPLLTVLAGLILVEIGDFVLFHDDTENFLSRFRIYSWIAIVLFSGFLIYDTNVIRKKAISVTNDCYGKQIGCVDYPTESLGIFLDLMNLFNNMSNIYGG
jgi:FtsH-binding integral membrane protein